MSKRYIQKRFEVEAVQWTGDNFDECQKFSGGKCRIDSEEFKSLCISNNDWVRPGDYIVKIEGEIVAFQKEDFERMCEELTVDYAYKEFIKMFTSALEAEGTPICKELLEAREKLAK